MYSNASFDVYAKKRGFRAKIIQKKLRCGILEKVKGEVRMMKIAIVDDEEYCSEEIAALSEEMTGKEKVPTEICIYESGEKFLAERKHKEFHGIFLDVEMDGVDGITLKEQLEQEEDQANIVFVTSHIEVMPEAFGRNVYGFLEKPLNRKRFEKIFAKMLHQYNCHRKISFQGINENQQVELSLADIIYIKASHVYTEVYTLQGKMYLNRKSLYEWEVELDGGEGFFRIHKSYLIHMGHIKKHEARAVVMVDELKIPISRQKIEEFRQSYRIFQKKEARYL